MRVLLVTDSMDLGGAETHIFTLATALAAAGETVEVCSAGGRMVPRLAAAGIPHHTLPFDRRTPRAILRCICGLRKLLPHYDVVHAHARYPAFLCARLHGRARFVTTCHAAYPPSIIDRLPLHGQHIFAVSADLRARLLSDGKLSPQSVSVLKNAVYAPTRTILREETERKLGLAPSNHRILAVHRMDADTVHPAKLLLKLLPHLRARYPDAQVVLVGDGTALAELNALAGEGAVLVGGVADTAPYYAVAELLVGISRSALEAMAQNVPVILAGTAGFAGMLTAQTLAAAMACNLTCRGEAPLTAEKLDTAISAFFDLPAHARRALGAFGREVVERHYAPATMADTVRRVYAWLRPPTRKMHTLFVGYFGSDNLGDDAMLLAEREFVEDCACLAASPRRAERTYGMPAYPKYRPLRLFGVLARTQQVVFGGGSLLQNKTSNRSLYYYATLFWLAGRFGCRRVFLANGLGPFMGKRAERIVKNILTCADIVTLRDAASLELARRLGVTRPISLCPDPALLLGVGETPTVMLPSACTLVCLRKNPHPAVQSALVEYGKERALMFIALQPGDLATAEQVAKNCNATVLPPLTAAELRALLAAGKIANVITMRYHLALFAAAAELPFLAVGEDPKLHGLCAALAAPPPAPAHALTVAHLRTVTAALATPVPNAYPLEQSLK